MVLIIIIIITTIRQAEKWRDSVLFSGINEWELKNLVY